MHPPIVILAGIMVALVFLVFMTVVLSRYTKVGPNQVLIISGRKIHLPDGRTVGYRIVKGGGTFVWPILEKAHVLSLETRVIDMPGCRAGTVEGRPVKLDCIAQVKIKGDDASIVAAAQHFLSKSDADIQQSVRLVLEEHLRAAVRGIGFEAIGSGLDVLSARVQAAACNDLAQMGLGLVSCAVQSVSAV